MIRKLNAEEETDGSEKLSAQGIFISKKEKKRDTERPTAYIVLRRHLRRVSPIFPQDMRKLAQVDPVEGHS